MPLSRTCLGFYGHLVHCLCIGAATGVALPTKSSGARPGCVQAAGVSDCHSPSAFPSTCGHRELLNR